MANINFSFGIQMDKSSVKQTQDEIKKIIQYFHRNCHIPIIPDMAHYWYIMSYSCHKLW